MPVGAYAVASDTGRRRRRNEDNYIVAPPLFAVGRNVNLAFRIGTHGQFMEHAQELVRRKVAVLVLAGSMPPPRLAASAATSSIPIVFVSAIDPVEAGVVTSLARPGGNITGVSTLNVEQSAVDD